MTITETRPMPLDLFRRLSMGPIRHSDGLNRVLDEWPVILDNPPKLTVANVTHKGISGEKCLPLTLEEGNKDIATNVKRILERSFLKPFKFAHGGIKYGEIYLRYHRSSESVSDIRPAPANFEYPLVEIQMKPKQCPIAKSRTSQSVDTTTVSGYFFNEKGQAIQYHWADWNTYKDRQNPRHINRDRETEKSLRYTEVTNGNRKVISPWLDLINTGRCKETPLIEQNHYSE